eukprot:323366-Chlamydomonas_euryale.AAC.3
MQKGDEVQFRKGDTRLCACVGAIVMWCLVCAAASSSACIVPESRHQKLWHAARHHSTRQTYGWYSSVLWSMDSTGCKVSS